MRDPYYYEDVPVLRNLLGIKDEKKLDAAETSLACSRLVDIDDQLSGRPFDYDRLKAIHYYIFCDIYEWAGEERIISMVKGERVLGGDTVRYSYPDNITNDAEQAIKKLNKVDWSRLDIHETADKFSKLIAELWQVHPFREGNTRTVMTFATQFAKAHGFKMNKQLLGNHADYVREALVKASDGQYSDYQYLTRIVEDAIAMG